MKNKIIPITFIIIFSLILWGSVTLSEYYVEIITVPVELIDLPQNYSPNYISDPEITLKVKAKGWELAKLILTGEHSFYVSAHHRIGKFRVDLRNEIENNLWLTSAFNVLEISPPIFEYEIDKTVTKKVSIKPNIKINFAENYDLVSDFVLTPSEVEISGPA
jgi:YbbR domain-containing protein